MSATEDVRYNLSLNDMLTAKLHGANEAAEGLEGTMSAVEKIAGTLGVAFGVFEGLNFIKEATEDFHGLEQANAQLRAGLESTKGVAGMTMESLEEQARGFDSVTLFSRKSLAETQSLLLTFPAITKANFDTATQSILDMSTRLKEDPKEAAIQLGKALQDPIKGITALHRVGVNFSEQQKAQVKEFVEHGNIIGAQTLILSELQTEFAGSAAAAFNADPAARYAKKMEDVKLELGELGEKVLTGLAPALEYLASKIEDGIKDLKDLYHWGQENKKLIEDTAEVVGIAVGAYIAYNIVVKINEGLIIARTGYLWAMDIAELAAATGNGLLTEAMWALNIAMDANPVGLVIAGLVLLAGAIYETIKHFDKIKAVISGVWAYVKTFAENIGHVFLAVGKIIYDTFSNPLNLASDYSELNRYAGNAGSEAATAYTNAYNKSLGINQSVDTTYDNFSLKNKPYIFGVDNKKGDNGKPGEDGATAPSKATGTKSVNVTINIGKLIETFNIKTANIQEAAGKIEELVANTLLKAVNDSSLYADL